MDGFDNNYSDSDDGKECGDDMLSCKECGAEFNIGAKGVSRLKELCSKCHSSAINILLGDDNGSAPITTPAHDSGLTEKGAGDVNAEMLPKVFPSSPSIIYCTTNTAAAK
jgi:hypothetical protein